MKAMDMTASLHKVWAQQLQYEFAQICYHYSIHLLHPVIEILETAACLGRWEKRSRTIGISARLILDFGWDSTIHVLKHEMAHQMCDEVFDCHGTPHDGDFLRACRLLGLPEKFCRAAIDRSCLIPDSSGDVDGQDNRRKLIKKVRKILAMSASANEHESQLALQLAVKIIDRYELEKAEIENDAIDAITYGIINLRQQRVHFYQRLIASLLSRYCNVRLIHSRLYDPLADEMFRTFEIFGRREHVEIAEYWYHFLVNRLETLWDAHRREESGSGRRGKSSYYCGVLHGFSEKLAKSQHARQQQTDGQTPGKGAKEDLSLPVAMAREIEICIARRHPRLRKHKSRNACVNEDAFSQGVAAGREIALQPAVGEGKGGSPAPRLLPEA